MLRHWDALDVPRSGHQWLLGFSPHMTVMLGLGKGLLSQGQLLQTLGMTASGRLSLPKAELKPHSFTDSKASCTSYPREFPSGEGTRATLPLAEISGIRASIYWMPFAKGASVWSVGGTEGEDPKPSPCKLGSALSPWPCSQLRSWCRDCTMRLLKIKCLKNTHFLFLYVMRSQVKAAIFVFHFVLNQWKLMLIAV